MIRAMATGVIFLLICTGVVGAQTVTECGKSDGYSYYFAGGLVPADKGGWTKDGIESGHIILYYTNGEYDLLIKNAIDTGTVKQAGGKIFARKTNNGLIALTAFYDDTGITEEYVFQINDRGEGTVAWTVVRTAAAINKMSVMTAQCRGRR